MPVKKETKVSQNPTPGNSKVKYAVNFNVSGFKQSVEDFETSIASKKLMSTSSIQSSPTGMYFFYAAYNDAGVEVSRRMGLPNGELVIPREYPTNNPFGYKPTSGSPDHFIDSLVAGNYTLVFVASETEIGLNNIREVDWNISVQPLSTAFFAYTLGLVDPYSRSSNTYFRKIPITVGQSNNEVDVVMNRLVGRVEINIEDAIPANASYFTFLFDKEHDQFAFNTETSGGGTGDIWLHEDNTLYPFQALITPQQIGQNNYTYNKYIINTSSPINVIINCYDAAKNLIATKTIANVQVYKNKRTLLTGKLFTPNIPESAFSVTVDDEWNTETDTVNF